MRILLVYGTTEGQTRKIAEFCSARLAEAGHDVEMKDSRRRMADLDMSSFDGSGQSSRGLSIRSSIRKPW